MQRLKGSGKHKNLQKPRLLQKPGPDEANDKKKRAGLGKRIFNSIEVDDVVGVSDLLRQGADVEAKGPEGWTLLAMAAFWERDEICRLLLEFRADANKTDRFGRTPLMLAAITGNTGLCELLLDKGANIGKKDQDGETAFSWAKRMKKEKTAEFLKQRLAEYSIRKLLGDAVSVRFLGVFRDCTAVQPAGKRN